jgi:hypothetical protein
MTLTTRRFDRNQRVWEGGASAPPAPSPTASRSPLTLGTLGEGPGVRVGVRFGAGLKPALFGNLEETFAGGEANGD